MIIKNGKAALQSCKTAFSFIQIMTFTRKNLYKLIIFIDFINYSIFIVNSSAVNFFFGIAF